jgi:hypothetical protein
VGRLGPSVFPIDRREGQGPASRSSFAENFENAEHFARGAARWLPALRGHSHPLSDDSASYAVSSANAALCTYGS